MQSEFACGRVNMCKADSEDLCQTTLPQGEQTGGESSFFNIWLKTKRSLARDWLLHRKHFRGLTGFWICQQHLWFYEMRVWALKSISLDMLKPDNCRSSRERTKDIPTHASYEPIWPIQVTWARPNSASNNTRECDATNQ